MQLDNAKSKFPFPWRGESTKRISKSYVHKNKNLNQCLDLLLHAKNVEYKRICEPIPRTYLEPTVPKLPLDFALWLKGKGNRLNTIERKLRYLKQLEVSPENC